MGQPGSEGLGEELRYHWTLLFPIGILRFSALTKQLLIKRTDRP